MGRGGRKATDSSSSSLETSNYPAALSTRPSPSQPHGNLTTDLGLGLGISTSHQQHHPRTSREQASDRTPNQPEEDTECNSATFFVKVYMEGIPIGRKLDLLAHDGYHDLIRTLDLMFNTTIIWAEMDVEDYEQCHVLTYEDKEGDWLMVGDVPWEMFLSCVRRLKITRVDK